MEAYDQFHQSVWDVAMEAMKAGMDTDQLTSDIDFGHDFMKENPEMGARMQIDAVYNFLTKDGGVNNTPELYEQYMEARDQFSSMIGADSPKASEPVVAVKSPAISTPGGP